VTAAKAQERAQGAAWRWRDAPWSPYAAWLHRRPSAAMVFQGQTALGVFSACRRRW